MQHSNPSSSSMITAAADSNPSATTTMSPSTFPLNILVMILKRVPVESILCLKRASKPWLSLLSSPVFISLHLHETAKDPQNHCFLIHSINDQPEHFNTMSLLNINSTDSEVVSFMHPFPLHYMGMDLVGSINGLVCLSVPPVGKHMTLWNRALMVYKSIWHSEKGLFWAGDVVDKISLGFAYDSVTDDYKIIRIALLLSNVENPYPNHPIMCFEVPSGAHFMTRAEIYSLKLGDWESIPVDLTFIVSSTRCNVIANGIPYWIGKIYEGTTQSQSTDVFLWYDMTNGSFNHIPMPEFERGEGTGAKAVEWKGNLGMIVYSPKSEIDSFVYVYLYDEKEIRWNKVSTHGPIALKMNKIIRCTKDGVILGETQEGKLFLYDPVTNGIKVFSVPRALKRTFKALSYIDSLVSSKSFESFCI